MNTGPEQTLKPETRDEILVDVANLIRKYGCTIGQFYDALGVSSDAFGEIEGIGPAVDFIEGYWRGAQSSV